MISYIKGEIIYDGGDTIVIENNGIGYELTAPAFSVQKLCSQKGEVKVYTYMSVKDDGITLFGFATKEEKAIYEKLISVSGIGPKAAVNILGVMTPQQLITAIVTSDVSAISRAPGIGKKTAQRVILDLKDKITNDDILTAGGSENELAGIIEASGGDEKSEAVEALLALGYTRSEAIKAVSRVYSDEMNVQKILSAALRELSRL